MAGECTVSSGESNIAFVARRGRQKAGSKKGEGVEIGRRAVIVGSSAALLAAPAVEAEPQAANPFAAFLAPDRKSLKLVRIAAGDDGQARIEESTVAGEPLAKTVLVQFLASKADKVAVYSAPPHHEVPARTVAAGTKELLYVIRGATTLSTKAGKRACGIGTMILCEDSTGTGHSEKAGPQGYTAIKVRITA